MDLDLIQRAELKGGSPGGYGGFRPAEGATGAMKEMNACYFLFSKIMMILRENIAGNE